MQNRLSVMSPNNNNNNNVYLCHVVAALNIVYLVLSGATGAQASPTWQSYASDISSSVSSYTLRGLRPAQSYQFRLSAVNAVGKGPASAPSRVITLPQQRTCQDVSLAAAWSPVYVSHCNTLAELAQALWQQIIRAVLSD